MRKQTLVAALVAAALCIAFAAPVASADPGRPFHGQVVGADRDAPPTDCPSGTFIRYSSTGTGQVLHLGRVHVEVTQCTRIDFATGAGSFDDGTITLTAANGDTLVLAQEGTFQLAPWPNFTTSTIDSMTWTVVGGTGRFEGATGSGTGSGFSDNVATPQSTTTVSLSGTIAY